MELHRQFKATWILVTHDQAEALLMGDRIAVLDRGRLLQCGPPRAIYQQPIDRFVATFVGNPPMNMLPCEAERDNESLRIHFIGAQHRLSWVLPGRTLPAGWPEGIDQVELGLRPETIGVREAGPSTEAVSSSPTFPAQVRRIEFNGPDLLATLALGPHLLVARLPSNQPILDRQHVHVVLNLDQAIWFDPATGRALNCDRG